MNIIMKVVINYLLFISLKIIFIYKWKKEMKIKNGLLLKKMEIAFSCIKSLDDKKLLGNNLNFLLNNLIISWDFERKIIKFIKYE